MLIYFIGVADEANCIRNRLADLLFCCSSFYYKDLFNWKGF